MYAANSPWPRKDYINVSFTTTYDNAMSQMLESGQRCTKVANVCKSQISVVEAAGLSQWDCIQPGGNWWFVLKPEAFFWAFAQLWMWSRELSFNQRGLGFGAGRCLKVPCRPCSKHGIRGISRYGQHNRNPYDGYMMGVWIPMNGLITIPYYPPIWTWYHPTFDHGTCQENMSTWSIHMSNPCSYILRVRLQQCLSAWTLVLAAQGTLRRFSGKNRSRTRQVRAVESIWVRNSFSKTEFIVLLIPVESTACCNPSQEHLHSRQGAHLRCVVIPEVAGGCVVSQHFTNWSKRSVQ